MPAGEPMAPELYAIALVFALLGLLALSSRRAKPPKRRLAIVETAALGQGRAVAVVQAGRKRLLVGVTGQSISALAELDPTEWAEAAESSPSRLQPLEPETP